MTTTQFDALNRAITVTDGSGGSVSYTFVNNDVLQKVGPTQTFQKQLEYDGLVRLTSVCEITSVPGSGSCGQSNSATGLLTKYSYDALGNVIAVTQNAQPGAIGGQQTRSYSYDGLGRLTSETNPETGQNSPGTVNYTYDVACGSYQASSGDLTKRADNAGNVTCYQYDGLHRLTDAGNSGPTCRHLRYDSIVTPPSGVTVSNTKSRVLEAYTDGCSGSKITDEWFSYDADGRMNGFYESTPHSGGYYPTSATYWANGVVDKLGLPSLPAIYYGASTGKYLDGEGRIQEVLASSGTTPVSNVTYSATTTMTALAGSLTGVSFQSGDSDSFSYDPTTGRQTGYTFSVNGATDTGTLTWNSNRTLGTLKIVDNIPGSRDSQTCNYFYDDLGRLAGRNSNGYSVDCGSTQLQQLFTLDPFGNITTTGSYPFVATYSASTNHITNLGVTYDANGNILHDDVGNNYTWDPNFGNSASVNGITLIYDALGRMVEQQGSSNAQILYSPLGKAAIMNGQNLVKAFVSLPGGGTGIYNSSGALAYYRHADWLGSSRLTSNAVAPLGAYSTTAYAPFGKQYAQSAGSDPSFTGQNSDTVASLYDFEYRENSPSQGRWISPDPSGMNAAKPDHPQSWNRYAYVLNNPLRYLDPSGLYCDYSDHNDPSSGFDPSQFDYHSNSGECTDHGGQWIDDAYTQNGADMEGRPGYAVASNTTAQLPQIQANTYSLGNIYNFGTFLGPMTVSNLLIGFYGTQLAKFSQCTASWAPSQNMANAPNVNATLSAQTLGLMSGGQGPAQGANNPQAGSNGTVYVAREYWDTGGVNQVNSNYGTFAHETANILDATKNGQNGNYERNYGNANDAVDKDTGAAIERCMFGSLQRPNHF